MQPHQQDDSRSEHTKRNKELAIGHDGFGLLNEIGSWRAQMGSFDGVIREKIGSVEGSRYLHHRTGVNQPFGDLGAGL